jgi:hypothetical protein
MQNNNKKSISIAIETAKCLALHHISTKNGKNFFFKKAFPVCIVVGDPIIKRRGLESH